MMSESEVPELRAGQSYDSWRSEVLKWQLFTPIEPRKQALAVRAKLSGPVRELALKIDSGELFNDDGLGIMISKLDVAFLNGNNKPPAESNRPKVRRFDQGPSGEKRRSRFSDTPPNGVQKTNERNNSSYQPNLYQQFKQKNDLSAEEKAKQRAAELSAKLVSQGKYQTQGAPILPAVKKAPFGISSQKSNTEIKKHDGGGYFAEININDVSARAFLTKSSTHELIGRQSSASLILRGRFLTEQDKKNCAISGQFEKPLTLFIQADLQAKVKVAIHKVEQVIANCDTHGYNGLLSNYGLTGTNSSQGNIQDKVFVGLINVDPVFGLREKIVGVNGSNLSFIARQTNAMVQLKGKGSGHLEPNSGKESFEPLHIHISMSHGHREALNTTKSLCDSLISTVKKDYNEWMMQKSKPHNHYAIPGMIPPGQPYPPPSLRYPQQRPPPGYQQPPPGYQQQPPPGYPPHQPPPGYPHQPPPGYQPPPHNYPPASYPNNSYPPPPLMNCNSAPPRNGQDDHSEERRDDSKRSEREDRRSRSPRRRNSRSPEKSKEKDKPRKRRKFTEDPNAILKSKQEQEKPAARLQFRSAKKDGPVKEKVDPFIAPPPPPPSLGKLPPPSSSKSNTTSSVSFEGFKAPPAIMKPPPKALKMGALSTIAIYSDDSDSDAD